MEHSESFELQPALPGRGATRLSAPAHRSAGQAFSQAEVSAEFAAISLEAQQRILTALAASISDNTRRNYQTDWRAFTAWCERTGTTPLPANPVTVADYITGAADTRTADGKRAYAIATLQRWISSINYFHAAAGYTTPGSHPLVKEAMKGARKIYKKERARPSNKAAALLEADMRLMLSVARRTATGWATQLVERRDSAILLIGWPGALRREELVTLTTTDIVRHRTDGLHITIPYSKTDQAGVGATIAIPYTVDHTICTPCAYFRWLQVIVAAENASTPRGRRQAIIAVLAETEAFEDHVCRGTLPRIRAAASGGGPEQVPVFRRIRANGHLGTDALRGHAVRDIVRQRAGAAGLDEELLAFVRAHSLRAGFVTQANRRGASITEIMAQTRHKNPATVIDYIRESDPLQGNAVVGIWGPGATTQDAS